MWICGNKIGSVGGIGVQMANVGFSGVFILLIPIITVIFWIAMMMAVFQIRNSTQDMSRKLSAIYELLEKQEKEK